MERFQTVLWTPSDPSLTGFLQERGRFSNFVRETCFLRCQAGSYYEADRKVLAQWSGREGCLYAEELTARIPPAETGRYVSLYNDGRINYPFTFADPLRQAGLEEAFGEVLRRFRAAKGQPAESVVRNFAVKLLYWMEAYFPKLFGEPRQFPKFACGGRVGLAEYLFLYLLFRLGCDVLHLSEGEVTGLPQDLLTLSQAVQERRAAVLPPVQREKRPSISLETMRRPERHSAPKPLAFEDLAKFASSVVMLQVFDQNRQCFKTGSGVVINDKGYILTNFHVVSGGLYYGILLEEETDVFYTDQLLKYNQDFDLAVLRMEKRRTPIPIYRGGKDLVRGQKVAAIGSPMGLFNSVSDGIISGFRTIGEVSMIQFTAPVSRGSSGGALLDLYGNLIGLTTGGFDDGQNLNLAVDYKTILSFVGGLL